MCFARKFHAHCQFKSGSASCNPYEVSVSTSGPRFDGPPIAGATFSSGGFCVAIAIVFARCQNVSCSGQASVDYKLVLFNEEGATRRVCELVVVVRSFSLGVAEATSQSGGSQ